jgi:hypothetical protein
MGAEPRRQRRRQDAVEQVAADEQDREATALAMKAAELEAEGRLAEAKALSRASRHRRVESLKTRAIATARKAI